MTFEDPLLPHTTGSNLVVQCSSYGDCQRPFMLPAISDQSGSSDFRNPNSISVLKSLVVALNWPLFRVYLVPSVVMLILKLPPQPCPTKPRHSRK